MSFYRFRMSAEVGQPDQLYIDGEIASEESWWGGKQTVARRFRQELARCGDVVVRINSPGGDVFAGAEIYTALKEHEGHVKVVVTGLAASAASVIAMAADELLMSPVSYLMIHDPWTFAVGNYREMEHTATVLREIGEGIIRAYTDKTGKSRADIEKLLENETWMNAESAVKEGFADGIADLGAENEPGTQNKTTMMQASRYAPAAICALVQGSGTADDPPSGSVTTASAPAPRWYIAPEMPPGPMMTGAHTHIISQHIHQIPGHAHSIAQPPETIHNDSENAKRAEIARRALLIASLDI